VAMNGETRALLKYWGFLTKSVDEAWYLLKWIGWDSFEFEKASHVSRYLCFDPYEFYARSYYAGFWCNLCNSSDHDINSCLLIMYAMLNITLHHLGTILMFFKHT